MRTFHSLTPKPALEAIMRRLSYLLPNFQNFDVMASAAHGRAIPAALILENTIYIVVYCAIVLLTAAAVFSRPHLNGNEKTKNHPLLVPSGAAAGTFCRHPTSAIALRPPPRT